MSGRNVEKLSARANRRRNLQTGERGGGTARPVSRDVGIRPQHSSLQSVLFDGGATLPLAVLLLPELFARPDARLDERHLSHVGRGTWHHDRDPGELVSGDVAIQADDGPAGLRRRRQSRSDANPRQKRVRGQSVGACRLGLSAASGRTFVCCRRSWRHRGHHGRAPRDFRLAHLHAPESPPVSRRNSIGISVTGSPMRPATTISMPTPRFKKKSASSLARLLRELPRSGRDVWWKPLRTSVRRARSDREPLPRACRVALFVIFRE